MWLRVALRLLVPLAKDPDKKRTTTPARQHDPAKLPATARAIRRMRPHRGRADYKLRAQTVEPVFGQIKTCQKLTMMGCRGLDACHSEWLLAAAAHNLRKLHTTASAHSATAPSPARRRDARPTKHRPWRHPRNLKQVDACALVVQQSTTMQLALLQQWKHQAGRTGRPGIRRWR